VLRSLIIQSCSDKEGETMLNLENLRAEVQELKETITEMGASL